MPLDVVRVAATGLAALVAGAWTGGAARRGRPPERVPGRRRRLGRALSRARDRAAAVSPTISRTTTSPAPPRPSPAPPSSPTGTTPRASPGRSATRSSSPISRASSPPTATRPAELFWSNEEFWRRWKSGEPLAVVLRRRALADWKAAGDSVADGGRVQPDVSCSDQRPPRPLRRQAMSADKTLIRETFLPFSRPGIGEEEIAELLDSLRSGWITTGPKVERFSQDVREVRRRQARRRALVGHRGTASRAAGPRHRPRRRGDHHAADLRGHGEHDRARRAPRRCSPTSTAPRCRCAPRRSRGGSASAPRRSSSSTTWATPPISIRSWRSRKQHKLAVIEDAAHAAGTEYKGRRIGSFDTTSVFSFHPNKNITTGEGGMLVTPDEEIFERVSPAQVPRHGPERLEALRQGGLAALRHRDARLQVQHDGHPGRARHPPAAAPRRLHRRAPPARDALPGGLQGDARA